MIASGLLLVLLDSVHETLKMEDRLEKAGIPFRSVIKPRYLGEDCGIALTFEEQFANRFYQLSKEAAVVIKGIYKQEGNEWKPRSLLTEEAQ
jgi:hypothetical protein